MKLTLTYDDGTEITAKVENLVLHQGTAGKEPAAIIGTKMGGNIAPLFSFPGYFFTPEALKAHEAALLEGKNGEAR